MRRCPVVAAPLLATAALPAALAAVAAQGWPGGPNACVAADACYCEALRPGWARQPANTWSCLAYVLAGLLAAIDGAARIGTRPGRSTCTFGTSRPAAATRRLATPPAFKVGGDEAGEAVEVAEKIQVAHDQLEVELHVVVHQDVAQSRRAR